MVDFQHAGTMPRERFERILRGAMKCFFDQEGKPIMRKNCGVAAQRIAAQVQAVIRRDRASQ